MRSSCLEWQPARAQLDVLRIQLHPHFLFTTLHAVSALLHRDPRRPARLDAALRSRQRRPEIDVRRAVDCRVDRFIPLAAPRAGARRSGREGATDTPLDDRYLARRLAAPMSAAGGASPASFTNARTGRVIRPAVNG